MEHYNTKGPTERAEPAADDIGMSSSHPSPVHGAPEIVGVKEPSGDQPTPEPTAPTVEEIDESKQSWIAYLTTRNFYIVLLLGQILALCITSTNTFSSLLVEQGTSIPAFQTFFNYILLNIGYTSYTWYRYGFKKWCRLIYRDGWRCMCSSFTMAIGLYLSLPWFFYLHNSMILPRMDHDRSLHWLLPIYLILSFLDVEGNYFTVLAYRYTSILSAQLINFWAIVMVVVISFLFLHVRYHVTQVLGILVCIGGFGILLASDHITGASNTGPISRGNQIKGDLFALLGATFYGVSNVVEEFLVSKRPLYEVVGQLGFWGMIINGTQAGIFDRTSFRKATWNGKVGGYLTGYTLILSLFYSLAPLMFRLASAAFFNISLLTGNFWGVAIGVEVFGYSIHWMYPIAFVCIIGGLIIYFLGRKVLGEARKPWLGENQELGVNGIGTAKRRAEN